MCVSSVNTTVTTDRPYFEMEGTWVLLGTPAIARSTGMLTYCSISTGDSAGAEVMICTCTLVTSGIASTGSRNAARKPNTTNSAVASSTTERFLSDHATIADSSCTLFLLCQRVAQHGALERECALSHHVHALA